MMAAQKLVTGVKNQGNEIFFGGKMIKSIQLLITTTLVQLISTGADAFTFECSDIKGVRFYYKEGKFVQSSDGYSGQTIEVTETEIGSTWSVEWKGRNSFSSTGAQVHFNEDQEWASFITPFKEVLRTYTLHLRDTILFFSEMQTQFLTLAPEGRVFAAKCRQLN